jgi:D-alanyl-D-alanine carboxypeptidase (penicillin-binding protein 5/6)
VPLTRRQIYRRRRVAFFGAAAIVLGTGFYLPVTLLAPVPATAAAILPYEAPVTEAAQLTFPARGATAVGAVGYPGILASSGSVEALPMASITKLITAMVVLEAKPIGVDDAGPDITFGAADVAIYKHYLQANGKVVKVKSGLVLTQRQVLDVTLIESGNNYAESLVNWAFGSEDAFVPVAREWLDRHDLPGIAINDSTGMDPNNTASAADLIALGKVAIADPLIAEIVSTKKEEIPWVGEIQNTNDLLGKSGVIGIKTGTLTETGSNLLFAANIVVGDENVTVVGVMLGGETHKILNVDVLTLLQGVQASFHEVILASAGQEYGSYTTEWGDSSELVATKDASVVVWGDTPVALMVEAPDVTVAEAGTDVGMLNFTIGTETREVPLELADSIDDPGGSWRLSHPAALL